MTGGSVEPIFRGRRTKTPTEENQKILKQREVYQIYVYINAYIPLNQQYKITNKDLSP